MINFIIVGLASGLLFGVLDGVIHGNPLAITLYEVYKPIARTSLNISAGIVTDLVYGFVLAGYSSSFIPACQAEMASSKGLAMPSSSGSCAW